MEGLGHSGGWFGFRFNGEGGEASCRIQSEGFQGPRGAGVQTRGAGSALMPLKGLIRGQIHREQQDAQEAPGTAFARDEQGVSALPSQACPHGQLAL
jgi:hypothetical protein